MPGPAWSDEPARPQRSARRVVLAVLVCVGCAPEAAPAADASASDAPSAPIATRIALDEVVLTQGVEIGLLRDGEVVAARNAPVVAGRDTLVRALVTASAGPVEVHATLHVEGMGGWSDVTVERRLEGASSRELPESVLDFRIAPELVTADATISLHVSVVGASGALSWPDGPALPLEAVSALAPLRLAFVPITSAGVTPDLGEPVLERYRTRLLDLYPVDRVELEVLPGETFEGDLCALSAWEAAVEQILARRAADEPDEGVFYVGLVQLADFRCTGVGGIATSLDGVHDPSVRGVVAYAMDPATTRDSATAVAHELGHVLGRPHAPCGGAAGPETSFPYEGGRIGTWGWSAAREQHFDPALYTDLMGYCAPVWISDYAYGALFDALVAVHTQEASP